MMNEAIFVLAGSAFGVMVTQGVVFMSNRNSAAIENKKVAIAEKDADAKSETHDDDHYLKASDATWKRVVELQGMQEKRINEMEKSGKEMEIKIEDLEVGKVADGKRIATLEQTVERLEKSLSDERKQHSATKKRELKLQERVRALESGKPPSMF